ncbi:hypothetical protein BDV06DRAFT_199164 [Aspergillus oleicola]
MMSSLYVISNTADFGSHGSSAELDIVVVHGLKLMGSKSHAQDTWLMDGKLWLKDFLPARLQTPARIMLFEYNASPAINSTAINLEDHAKSLLQWLTVKRRES